LRGEWGNLQKTVKMQNNDDDKRDLTMFK